MFSKYLCSYVSGCDQGLTPIPPVGTDLLITPRSPMEPTIAHRDPHVVLIK